MAQATAVLYSGGLDSAVLVDMLSRDGGGAADAVVPIYVDCGLSWQAAELTAARRFIAALGRKAVADPVVLLLPVTDLYGDHWSINGRDVPDEASPDEAVYLPGRNALLAVKPLVWCGLHGVRRLAIATLAGNPFPDARDDFFTAFSRALSLALATDLEIVRPFAGMSKRAVMIEGRHAPLEETFSCIDPQAAGPQRFVHCGRCNKCAERRRAFLEADVADKTPYAA